MVVDFLNYTLEFDEEKREIRVFVKVGGFRIEKSQSEGQLFTPQQANVINIDYDTGMVKNLEDQFYFLGQKMENKSYSIKELMNQVLGFEYEMQMAYEKALYYRAIKKYNYV